MGNLAQRMCAKAGGMADVSSSLINALYQQGADVHVAIPNYRRMFDNFQKAFLEKGNQEMSELLVFSTKIRSTNHLRIITPH